MADSEGAGAEVIIPVETEGTVELAVDKPGEAPPALAPAVSQEPVVAKVSPEPAQKIVTADEGIESLKDQVARAQAESQRRLNESQRKIQEAFENTRRAEERAANAEKEVTSVKQGAVLTVLDSLKRDKEDARRKYALAADGGDHAKMAEAVDELSLANTRIIEAEKGKLELEERAKAPPVVATARRVEPLADDDRAEQFAASIESHSPRSAQWVREHPEYARDQTKNDDMTAAHYAALGKRLKPETPAYFEFINRELGITKAPAQVIETPPAREQARAPASAPVSRDVAQSPSA